MGFKDLYQQYVPNLEDFWGRKNNQPCYQKQETLFGIPLEISSNDERIMTAFAGISPQYSKAPPLNQPPLKLQFVVRSGRQAIPQPPNDLFPLIQYTGAGEWLMLHIGMWGHTFIDLKQGWAWTTLTPELASKPELVGRCLLNTIFTNRLFCAFFN